MPNFLDAKNNKKTTKYIKFSIKKYIGKNWSEAINTFVLSLRIRKVLPVFLIFSLLRLRASFDEFVK